MNSYAYRKADAFTAEGSLGNPAACLYLSDGERLSDEKMQEIARQHKGYVSEVVFCTERADGCFELVYYSSECEVNFCGHGTIACMHSLIKGRQDLLTKPEITLITRKNGVLTLYNDIPSRDAVYISAPVPTHLKVPVTAASVAEKLGASAECVSDRYPVDFIDVGNRTLILPLTDLKTEVSLFPDEAALRRYTLENGIDIILIFCMATEDKRHFAHTRVFAAKYGYLEDPATGSGNSAFGYYLLKNGMWQGEDITLEQGGCDRKFNTIFLAAREGGLLFGGSSSTRVDGQYFI